MNPGGSREGGSKLQVFQDCHKKYYWAHEYGGSGLVPTGPSEAMAINFGLAVHAGLEKYYDPTARLIGLSPTDRALGALNNAVTKMNDLVPEPTPEQEALIEQVKKCLGQYFEFYKEEDLVPVAVEELFSMQVGGFEHTGITDLIAHYGGHLVVVDHKTTQKDWGTFFKKWRFDLSLMGYIYKARQRYNYPVQLLVNGIRRTRHKVPQYEFQRELFFFSDEDLIEWAQSVTQIRQDIQTRKQEGRVWEKNSSQCAVFGECSYRKLCLYPDDSMVKTFYKPRTQEDLVHATVNDAD